MAGDCYEANGRLFLQLSRTGKTRGLRLVHGEVTGTGGAVLGVNYGHAWVEQGSTVLDVSNGRNLKIPRELYYALGGIVENGNLRRYTYAQAIRWMLKLEHWGPWDLKTTTGL